MAQFDVHRNTGRNRAAIPYVVIIQSRRFDQARTRLVAALRAGRGDVGSNLMPQFRIEGKDVYLDPLQIVAIPTASLGPAVGSLSDDASADRVIAAIDEVISRVYG